MCRGRANNSRVRIIYSDKHTTHEMSEEDSFHDRNLQIVAMGMYKVSKGLHLQF